MSHIEIYDFPIPSVLVQMKNLLIQKGGHETEGIFRVAPSSSKVAAVQVQLDSGSAVSCEDVHCISHLIKSWFRDCPDKILTDLDPKMFGPASKDAAERRKLVDMIPEPKRSIFLWILDLCVTCSHFSSLSRMDSRNLAIVFAPNLFPFEALGADPTKTMLIAEDVIEFVNQSVQDRAIDVPYVNPDLTLIDEVDLKSTLHKSDTFDLPIDYSISRSHSEESVTLSESKITEPPRQDSRSKEDSHSTVP